MTLVLFSRDLRPRACETCTRPVAHYFRLSTLLRNCAATLTMALVPYSRNYELSHKNLLTAYFSKIRNVLKTHESCHKNVLTAYFAKIRNVLKTARITSQNCAYCMVFRNSKHSENAWRRRVARRELLYNSWNWSMRKTALAVFVPVDPHTRSRASRDKYGTATAPLLIAHMFQPTYNM